jgi:hypothetical protein
MHRENTNDYRNGHNWVCSKYSAVVRGAYLRICVFAYLRISVLAYFAYLHGALISYCHSFLLLASAGRPGGARVVDTLGHFLPRARQQALVVGQHAAGLSGLDTPKSAAVLAHGDLDDNRRR